MPGDRDREKETAAEAGVVVEDVAAGVVGVGVGASLIPVAGPLAPIAGALAASAVKAVGSLVRQHARDRSGDRLARYEEQLHEAARAVDPDELAALVQDERFGELAYQNYRRAVDAVDPCVLPALARLTFETRTTGIDRFFRAAGRLLEQLTAVEFRCARDLLTAAAHVPARVVSIVPWRGARRVEELRLSPSRKARYLDQAAPEQREHVRGIRADGPFREVLDLMARSGLEFIPPRSGRDLGSVGEFDIEHDVVQRLLRVVEPVEVDVYPAEFDRLPDAVSSGATAPEQRPPSTGSETATRRRRGTPTGRRPK